MSQATDYDVANASGASVRADLNTILLAIASLNAGTAAPSTTYANMLWVDTTNGLLKKRNNANSSWIQLGPMDNRLEGRVPILSKSAGYTAVAADRGSLIDFTTAGVTLAYTAAATLGADWYIYVRNSAASGVITHAPNSTEQIDGATTITQASGESWLVVCDGTGFKTVGRVPAGGIVPTATMAPYGGRTAPTGWLMCNGAAVSRSTYAALFTALVFSSTVTMTIASPCVVSWNSHGMNDGDPVVFTTTGALPTGLTAGSTYYVKSPSTNSFNVSATPGGSAINTSGSQSGTHTAVSAPYGAGDGSTTFNTPDLRGRSPFGHDVMGNAAASRITNAGAGIYGASLGQSGGAETHTLTTAQLASHDHSINIVQGASGFASGVNLNITAASTTGPTGSGNAHNNMPPALIANWIIKA